MTRQLPRNVWLYSWVFSLNSVTEHLRDARCALIHTLDLPGVMLAYHLATRAVEVIRTDPVILQATKLDVSLNSPCHAGQHAAVLA